MKLSVGRGGAVVLQDVFNNVTIKTTGGEAEVGVCDREGHIYVIHDGVEHYFPPYEMADGTRVHNSSEWPPHKQTCGDECPICRCGTLDERLSCQGECGTPGGLEDS